MAYRDAEGRLLSADSVSDVGEYALERIPVEKVCHQITIFLLK